MMLTERQALVLSTLIAMIEKQGFPPSLAELGKAVGIKSVRGVEVHVQVLATKGYICKGAHTSRGLQVLKDASGRRLELKHVPVAE